MTQKKKTSWTPRELEILKRDYPVKTCQEIADSIGRGVRATYIMAYRLGLKKDHYGKGWTPRMILMLRTLYPITFNYALAKYFGMSKTSVIRKARQLGLYKEPGFVENRKMVIGKLISEGHSRSTKPNPGNFKKGVHSNPACEFKKGHVESPETKEKRRAALRAAWARRKQLAQFRSDYNINNQI